MRVGIFSAFCLVVLGCGAVESDSTLNVTFAGDGRGHVVAKDPGVDCSDSCTVQVEGGIAIILEAMPEEGMVFVSWSDPSCGTTPMCEITVDKNLDIEAIFATDQCPEDDAKHEPGNCGCGVPEDDCIQDCNGVFGGPATLDNCGTCDDNPDNDCTADCAGDFDGSATRDNCGTCDDNPDNDCTLEFVSANPSDNNTTDRNVNIQITLSRDVDAATVANSSVSLNGPDGSVNTTATAQGAKITITPSQPLKLLGDYTITVKKGVKSAEGAILDQDIVSRFRVNDGKWRSPTKVGSLEGFVSETSSNPRGDMIVTWNQKQAQYAGVYTAETRVWKAQKIGSNFQSQSRVSMNDIGDAIVVWKTTNTKDIAWVRYTDGQWGTARTATFGTTANHAVGLPNSGTAIFAWTPSLPSSTTPLGNKAFSSMLARVNTTWSGAHTYSQAGSPWAAISNGDVVHLFSETHSATVLFGGTYQVLRFTSANGLGGPVSLGSANTDNNFVGFSRSTHGNVMATWSQNKVVQVALGNGSSWIKGFPLGSGTTGGGACEGAAGEYISVWVDAQNNTLNARHTDTKGNWGATQPLGSRGKMELARCVADSDGNAVALWHSFSSAPPMWSRYIRDKGWSSSPQPIPSSVGDIKTVAIDAQRNITLVYADADTVWSTTFQ